jgi:cephalosporin hydroxylase
MVKPDVVPPAVDGNRGPAPGPWTAPPRGSLVRPADFRRVFGRLRLAADVALAATRDPAACRIAALAIRRHGALQKPLELIRYLSFLRQRRTMNALETGALWGGMTYAHAAVAAPGGRLIAIDAFPREGHERMTARLQGLVRPDQRLTCLWQDSHEPETVRAVADTLAGEPLDVLFLDGDHTAEGVRRDYDTFAPFVRSGGVIALHDIDADRPGRVRDFWQSLRTRVEAFEIIDRVHPPYGLGIGVVVKA